MSAANREFHTYLFATQFTLELTVFVTQGTIHFLLWSRDQRRYWSVHRQKETFCMNISTPTGISYLPTWLKYRCFSLPISPQWCLVKTLIKKKWIVWFCCFLNSCVAPKNVRMDWSARKRDFGACTNAQLSQLRQQKNQDLETWTSEPLAQKTRLKNHRISSLDGIKSNWRILNVILF